MIHVNDDLQVINTEQSLCNKCFTVHFMVKDERDLQSHVASQSQIKPFFHKINKPSNFIVHYGGNNDIVTLYFRLINRTLIALSMLQVPYFTTVSYAFKSSPPKLV